MKKTIVTILGISLAFNAINAYNKNSSYGRQSQNQSRTFGEENWNNQDNNWNETNEQGNRKNKKRYRRGDARGYQGQDQRGQRLEQRPNQMSQENPGQMGQEVHNEPSSIATAKPEAQSVN